MNAGTEIVTNLTDSLQHGLLMLVLAIPAYMLIIGGFYWLRSRGQDQFKRSQIRDPKVMDEVTKGWFGEENQAVATDTRLPAFSGVMLADMDGAYVSVDHLLRLENGLVVLTRDDHGGVLTGTEDEVEWRQATRAGSLPMDNPLRRNRRAVETVKKLVNPEGAGAEIPVWGRVLFPDHAEFPGLATPELCHMGDAPGCLLLPDLPEVEHDRMAEAWSLIRRRAVISEPEGDMAGALLGLQRETRRSHPLGRIEPRWIAVAGAVLMLALLAAALFR
jgi:hypothetical protein